MYRVELHREARKEFDKLPEGTKKNVFEAFLRLKSAPYPHREYDLKKLKGFEGVYRIRIGKYRIVYYVDENEALVTVLIIAQRKKVYKSLKHRIK